MESAVVCVPDATKALYLTATMVNYTIAIQARKHHIMSTEYHSKEHQILSTVRKVLSKVVKDTTPPPNMPHVLRPATIEDLKHCFMLITAREKEIIDAAGGTEMDKRPRYADEPKTSQVVQFPASSNKTSDPDSTDK